MLNAKAIVVERSEVEAKRPKVMVSSSLVPIGNTHRQHKQELVVANGGAITIAHVVIASHVPTPVLLAFGLKLIVNKE